MRRRLAGTRSACCVGGALALGLVGSGPASGVETARGRGPLLPFADLHARCQAILWYGSPDPPRCLAPAVRDLTRRLSRARRTGADGQTIARLEFRLGMARGALRAAPLRPGARTPRLTPAQVTRARGIAGRSALLAQIADGQPAAIEDVGLVQNGSGTVGVAFNVTWPRPVTLRDFAWPTEGGCANGRPFRGVRRVPIPLVRALTQVTVTVNFRRGRIVSIQPGPDHLALGPTPPPLLPDPATLVLAPADLGAGYVADPAAGRFASLTEEGTPERLRCAVAATGRREGYAAVLRATTPTGSPSLVVSAVVLAQTENGARGLFRLASPLATFLGFRPRPVAAPGRVGDESVLYAAAEPGPGRASGLGIVWREGRAIGVVFAAPRAPGAARAVFDLALRQETRMAAALDG